MTTEAPPVNPDAPPASGLDPDLERALGVELSGLHRVVYTVRLYGIGHEHARGYADETLLQLKPRLGQLGLIRLDVSDGTIDFQGQPVITDPPTGGLADELYRDGIRALVLKDGLTTEEFLELLAILGTNFHLPQHQEDTLQGLLWAADLPHVEYESVQGIEEAIEDSADAGRGEQIDVQAVCAQVLEIEADDLMSADFSLIGDLLQEADVSPRPTAPLLPALDPDDQLFDRRDIGGAEGVPLESLDTDSAATVDDGDDPDATETVEDASTTVEDARATVEDATETVEDVGDDEASKSELSLSGSPEERRATLKATFGTGVHRIMPATSLQATDFVHGHQDKLEVPPEALLALWEELDADQASVLLDRTVDILAHSALRSDIALGVTDVGELLTRLIEQAADSGLTHRYRATVDAVAAAGIDDDEEARFACATLLEHLVDRGLLLRYAAHADLDDSTVARDLEGIITRGGTELALDLLDQAPSIEDRHCQRFVVQLIVQALDGDPRPLLDELHHMEPDHLRLRIEALARMDSFTARDQLAAMLTHAEADVRRAVVEVMPSAYLRAVWKRVAKMLADDRDVAVRCAVIRRLTAEQLPVVVPLLSKMVSAESFHTRDTEEKQLALDTLAVVGGVDVVDTLAELLSQKVRIASPKLSETRRLTAMALSRIRGIQSRTVLKRASQSWDPGLRRAAREALETQKGRQS